MGVAILNEDARHVCWLENATNDRQRCFYISIWRSIRSNSAVSYQGILKEGSKIKHLNLSGRLEISCDQRSPDNRWSTVAGIFHGFRGLEANYNSCPRNFEVCD